MPVFKHLVSCVFAGLVLGGVSIDRAFFHESPANAEPYHDHVREALKAFSPRSGPWLGVDSPVTPGAVALLRPNITLARSYTNINSAHKASLLLVQCRDARDLIGHYPPICYQAAGWSMVSAKRVDWTVNNTTFHGTMYEFASSRLAGKSSMNIFNVMILPNGRTAPDMDGVYTIARDRKMRYFGAAQLQILSNTDLPDNVHHDVIDNLLQSAAPVIDAIRTGVSP